MNATTRKHRLAALASAIGALLILGGAAQAETPTPAGMTDAEYRALMLRSQALNDRYGLGWHADKPDSMTAAEFRALMLRSQGLNEMYGPGESAVAAPAAQPEPTVVATDGFAWSDFGIGAAAMLGFVLLVGGLMVGGRLGRGALKARSSS